jgi:hypothetical protein
MVLAGVDVRKIFSPGQDCSVSSECVTQSEILESRFYIEAEEVRVLDRESSRILAVFHREGLRETAEQLRGADAR